MPAADDERAAAGDATAPRPPLSWNRLLAAALDIVDRDGIEALSMRRLGQALGRDPMSLYRLAPDKAAVLDGLVECVVEELSVSTEGAEWAGELRQLARAFRQLALAHPNVVPLLVTRPLSTPLGLRPLGTLRPLEDILELLVHAGFSEAAALQAYRSFFGFLHGHVLNEVQELVANADETDDLLRLGLHRLPVREFPRVRALAGEFASYDGAAELEQGLDILLTGLSARRDLTN
jgi:AcrR family transcriptional regulator